jgi:hypothetical protein
MFNQNFLSKCLLAGTFILSASAVIAGPPPATTPIDGGLTLVIAACAGYGVKKIRDSRKKA